MYQLGKIDVTAAMKMLSKPAVNQAPSIPSKPAVDGKNAPAAAEKKKRPRSDDLDNNDSDSEIAEEAFDHMES